MTQPNYNKKKRKQNTSVNETQVKNTFFWLPPIKHFPPYISYLILAQIQLVQMCQHVVHLRIHIQQMTPSDF